MTDIKKIINNIGRISVSDYPVQVLEKTIQNFEQQQQKIADQLLILEAKIPKEIEAGNIVAVREIQDQARKMEQEYRSFTEEIQTLLNYKQEKVLKERIINSLGSQSLYRFKEFIITSLVLFVLSLLVYESTNPNLPIKTVKLFFQMDVCCCLIFLINFFYELRLADSKKWYWRTHFIDFISSIPIPDMRLLRSLRGIRVIRLTRFLRFFKFLRFLRFLRVLMIFWRGLDQLADMFNVRLLKKSLIYACISLFLGAICFHLLETVEETGEHPGAVASVWWSFATVVTGGFADIHDPQTGGGKILTVILVLVGMVIIGIFTATLTSVMVGDDDDIEKLRQEINGQFEQLTSRVNEIDNNRSSSNSNRSL